MIEYLRKTEIGSWQSCGFSKSNVLIINYDLPSVWSEFKTIDTSDFASFYFQCCLNLSAALGYITTFKGGSSQKLTNELEQSFKVAPKSGVCFRTSNVELNDLIMTDHPPKFQRYPEQDKATILQSATNGLQYLLKKKQKTNSKNTQEKFAAIIIQYIQWRSRSTNEWDLIFSQQKFAERITRRVVEFLRGRNHFDNELIQTLVLQIDNVLEGYTNDFKMFGLSLTQEATSIAHKIAFRITLDVFTARRKSKTYLVNDLWLAKRDGLLEFFVSHLGPDQTKDEENAKQFLRKFAESIDRTLSEQLQTLITTKLNESEGEFSRLRLQKKRDAIMISSTSEDLLQYVLDPNTFIYNDFKIVWKNFKSLLREEFRTIQKEQMNLFDELKIIFAKLNESITSLKVARETFKADELFRTTQLLSESEKNINKNLYLKVFLHF